MKFSWKLEGFDAVDDLFKELPELTRGNSAANALRGGARVIRDEARRRAPVGDRPSLGGKSQPGQLRRAIKVVTPKEQEAGERHVLVQVTNRDAGVNPHWIEYGTGPRIAKSPDGYLYFTIGSRLIRKKAVAGVSPQPFMRPAADVKAREAIEVIGRMLGPAIEKDAARIARRRGRR